MQFYIILEKVPTMSGKYIKIDKEWLNFGSINFLEKDIINTKYNKLKTYYFNTQTSGTIIFKISDKSLNIISNPP